MRPSAAYLNIPGICLSNSHQFTGRIESVHVLVGFCQNAHPNQIRTVMQAVIDMELAVDRVAAL
jgi:sirohydrochlorin ferrochelatase